MITSAAFAGRRYAVLGLARSGAAAAESLIASGARVTVWDRQDEPREAFAGRAQIADPLTCDLSGLDAIVVSPGVPLNSHPIAERARQFGVPIIGDIELFSQARGGLPPHQVVGITGTNGKSTTTALVAHILREAGRPVRMGGNIGLPVLAADPLEPNEKGVGVYVLELSSYQIDLTRSLACEVAALLNISPDHLDRYDGLEAYAFAKSRLFAMQGSGQLAIFGNGDPLTRAFRDAAQDRRGADRVRSIDTARYAERQQLWPSLQGPHNLENAAAAIAIVSELGVQEADWAPALESFGGLPHRMERLGEYRGILFVNDSKATNPASAAPALAAFPPDESIHGGTPRIHWIVGGLPKEDGLGECAQYLGNVACAYTVGESGPRFAELLQGRVPVEPSEMICEATRRALGSARAGDVILLSPACASFDQFRDYEKRGDHFRTVIEVLTGNKLEAGSASISGTEVRKQ